MFSTFRKLFGRRNNENAVVGTLEMPAPVQPPSAHPVPPAARMRVDFQPRPKADVHTNAAPAITSGTLGLSLRAVMGRLPPDLMERVRQIDVGEAEVFVSMQKVLSQLPQGSVKISFGELRQAAPPGTFSSENDRDRFLVDLPLQEILVRLGANGLGRRTAQKRIEVPAEVQGPFGGQNRVTISEAPLKAPIPAKQTPAAVPEESGFRRINTPTAPPTPVYSPIAPSTLPPTKVTPLPLPGSPVFNRVNQPAPAASVKPAYVPDEPIFKRATPAAPSYPPAQPSEEPIFRRNNGPVHAPAPTPEAEPEEPIFKRANPPTAPVVSPIVPASPQAIPFGDPAPIPGPSLRTFSPPMTPPAPVALPTPEAEPQPIRFNPSFAPPSATPPAPRPAPVPPAPRETIFMTVPLADLAEPWPEPVKQEVIALGLLGASVALPQGMIESAIKQGKVLFPWKVVRSWIKPPVSPNHVSPEDGTPVELPLKVVTPAFLSSLRAVRPQKKVSLDSNIPNLFSGTAGAEAPAVPATSAPPMSIPAATPRHVVPLPAPVVVPLPVQPPPAHAPAPSQTDTNYYVFKDNGATASEEAPPVIKKGPSPGTSFLQRYATPNEIVAKAASLNGVGGALIALPDGLLVASKIPADMNADTLAAFLPQIFGRVSQSTRELRMGDLNNLNFTVGLIPWKIFRVGAIYFAAFGIAGQALPTAQLAGIAAELDRKAK